MRNARTLLVAVPAFLLGGLATAALTATAQAQGSAKAMPKYRIVVSETDLNKLAAHGYEVKFVTGDHLGSQYLMQRY